VFLSVVVVGPLDFGNRLTPGETPERAEHDPAGAIESVAVPKNGFKKMLIPTAYPGGRAFIEPRPSEGDELHSFALAPLSQLPPPVLAS